MSVKFAIPDLPEWWKNFLRSFKMLEEKNGEEYLAPSGAIDDSDSFDYEYPANIFKIPSVFTLCQILLAYAIIGRNTKFLVSALSEG